MSNSQSLDHQVAHEKLEQAIAHFTKGELQKSLEEFEFFLVEHPNNLTALSYQNTLQELIAWGVTPTESAEGFGEILQHYHNSNYDVAHAWAMQQLQVTPDATYLTKLLMLLDMKAMERRGNTGSYHTYSSQGSLSHSQNHHYYPQPQQPSSLSKMTRWITAIAFFLFLGQIGAFSIFYLRKMRNKKPKPPTQTRQTETDLGLLHYKQAKSFFEKKLYLASTEQLTLARKKNKDEARKELFDQLEKKLKLAPLLDHGVQLMNNKSYSKARAQFKAILEQDPLNALALKHIAQLRDLAPPERRDDTPEPPERTKPEKRKAKKRRRRNRRRRRRRPRSRKRRVAMAKKPSVGRLEITSKPKAFIYLDGVLRGATPIKIAKFKAGEHKLEAKRPNYKTVSQAFEVKANKTTTVTLNMLPVEKPKPRPVIRRVRPRPRPIVERRPPPRRKKVAVAPPPRPRIRPLRLPKTLRLREFVSDARFLVRRRMNKIRRAFRYIERKAATSIGKSSSALSGTTDKLQLFIIGDLMTDTDWVKVYPAKLGNKLRQLALKGKSKSAISRELVRLQRNNSLFAK